jgi:pimeloyl-[acyl-carrier protein] methyl ester esterase
MNINLTKQGEGIPLVLFHGWGFDSQIWDSLLSQIQCSYSLITVDLPGFGLTPLMEWSQFKNQLLTQLPKQCIVLGWSMGGLYATRLALEEPSRVRGLINVASSPCFLLTEDWPGISKEIFSNFYKNLLKDSEATLEEFIRLQTNQNRLNVCLGKLPTPEGLKLGLEILGTWDFREQLKQIKLPTCYMFGRLDPIVPLTTMKIMKKIYPEFNYIFFNQAAHMPFLSHRDLFIKELKGFIQ